jgi:hypothetical protein
MKEIVTDEKQVAYCGLYCAACNAYLKGKCPGCHENAKAGWCKIRTCCSDNGYLSCAECHEIADPNDCKKFNNFISKVFAVVFRSNRAACIEQIKAEGMAGHARKMAAYGHQSLPR